MTQTSELPTVYQSIIAKSRYSRYLPEENRRETWEETVDRLIDYLIYKVQNLDISEEEKQKLLKALG